MKKNYFKKSLSLVLTVLMLMSCWVFVPGEHRIESSAYSVADYGMTAVTGTSMQTSTFSDLRTDANSDKITIKYPSVMYMDISEDLADTGYSINLSTTFGDGSNYKLTILPSFWGGQEFGDGKTSATKDLQGQTQLVDNFTNFGINRGSIGSWDNYGRDSYNISLAISDPKGTIGNGANFSFSGRPTTTGVFSYDGSKADGSTNADPKTPMTGVYYKSGWRGYTKYSYFNDVHDSGSPTNYQIIVYDKSKLYEAKNTANGYLTQTSKYTSESLATLQTAVDNGKSILKKREVTSTQIENARIAINNAIAGLVIKRDYDVTYENLFSLTDWSYTDSKVATGTSTGEVVVEANAIKIYKSGAGNELTTSSSFSGDHKDTMYSMPVEGGKDYTVRFNITSSVSGTPTSEVFLFWYDANNTPVVGTNNGNNTFNNKSFNGDGVKTVTFTVPANAVKCEIRFDNDSATSASTIRFNDIAFYPAERAEKVDLDNWTTRPVKKSFAYHSTLSGALDIPARPGYKFEGWYIDNVIANGEMDDGEAVTDANGNVIKALKMDKTYYLYAAWTPLTYDIGYDNLFLFAEFVKTGSVNPSKAANGTVAYDVMAGTVTVESTANDEVYTTYGSDGYTMDVKPNTEYVFEVDMNGTTSTSNALRGQMFIFCYDVNGNSVTGPTQIKNGGETTFADAQHIGEYLATNGTHQIVFRTPANCYKLRVRIGATNVGTKAVYSNIGVYEKAVYDAYAKDYTIVRQAFSVGDTASLSYTPVREGYVFDGWYTADGTKLTSVAGLSASTTVYAHWTKKFTVTFKNYDGTVLNTVEVAPGASATDSAPQNLVKASDADFEYTFSGWSEAITNIQSDLVVTAVFTTNAHSNITKTTKSQANCTSPATYTQSCSCGYKWEGVFEDASKPALGHTYERANPTGEVVKDKGTDAGHTVKCLVCDATTTKAHDFKEFGSSEATCIKAGEKYYKCACTREKTETGSINPDNHANTTTINAKDPACEVKGYTGDTYCNDCKKTVAYGKDIDALKHEYTKYVYNNDAKCGVNGTETANCDLCGKAPVTREAANTALDHIFTNYVDQNDATCDAEGTEIAVCDRDGCNEKDSRSTGEKREHKFDGTAKKNNDGTHSFECSYDDCAVYGGTVDCGYGAWTKDDAATHSHTCKTCGYTPAAEAHDWSKWSQATGNTGDAAGKMIRICNVCGREETTDCTYTSVKTEATCEADAYTTYTCKDCGHGYTETDVGSATGHEFNGAYKFDADTDKHQQACTNEDCTAYGVGKDKDKWADCTWTYANKEAGKHTASCVCGNSEEQTCSGGTATCTDKAVCQFCNTAYGEKAPHDITGTAKYIKKATDATCIANETYYKYCINCENEFSAETYEKPDTMTEHDYTCKAEYLYKATDAKCEVNETYYAYCSNRDCKKSSEDANNTFEKDGTALDHIWVNAKYNGENTLKHTFTCERGCDKTMEANCADSAITFGLEEATCTEQGYTTVQCTACNHTWNINYTNALGHDYTQKIYDDAHTKSEANCDQAKVYWYDCSRCDKNAKDETDTEKYTDLTYYSGDVRPHKWNKKVDDNYLASKATCLAAAKYYLSCEYDDCDAVDSDTFSSGSPLNHNWVKPADDVLDDYLATPADCVTDATYYYTCSRAAECGCTTSKGVTDETWTKENSKSSHKDATHTEYKDADCDNPGNYEYWYCSKCNKYFKDGEFKEAYVAQSETVIPKLGHSYKVVDRVEATCEKDGNAAYELCERCKTENPNNPKKVINAKGHKFTGAYYIDTVHNYHARYCSNAYCDLVNLGDTQVKTFGSVINGEQVKYQVISDPVDGDTVIGGIKCDFDIVAETDNNGVHTHTLTCECGNSQSAIIEMTKKTVAPTCTEKGYDLYTCTDEECGATWKTNYVKANNHTISATATANNDGTHSYYCTVKDCGVVVKTEKCSGGSATCKELAKCAKCGAEHGDYADHVYDEDAWTYNNDHSNTSNGTESNKCTVCEKLATRELEVAKHVMTDYGYTVPEKLVEILKADNVEIKEPTCKDEGKQISYCELCDYYKTVSVPNKSDKHVWETDESGEEVWVTKSGDCSTGIVESCKCIYCDEFKSRTVYDGHEWIVATVVRDVCDQYDYIIFKCANCNTDERFDEHYEYTDKDGVKHGYLIDGTFVDGVDYVTARNLKKVEHNYGDPVVTKKATCFEDGREERTCSKCKYVKVDVIKRDADAHNPEKWNTEGYENIIKIEAREATCTAPGNKEYFECRDCSFSMNSNDQYTIPALGHDYNADGECTRKGCNSKKADEKADGCICHKDNGFMKFIYKILRFFWKLFKINKECTCGAVHY